MTITEKVAYLRGLSEGMSIDEKSNEGRLLKAIIDVLDDMAFSIADVEDGLDAVSYTHLDVYKRQVGRLRPANRKLRDQEPHPSRGGDQE